MQGRVHMSKALTWIVIIAAAAALAWYWSVRQDEAALEQAQVLPPAPLPLEPAKPEIEHPVERISPAGPEAGMPERIEPETPLVPLPPLADSDEEMLGVATGLAGEGLAAWLVTDQLVSRMVATIDALDSARVAQPMRPLTPVAEQFRVLGAGDEAAISPQNAERYQPYVDLLLGLSTAQVAESYRHYYPLFQQAYQDQGYPDGYFNDRLVAIVDHLLGAPEPTGVLAVRQNEAVYEFVREEYEQLSAGQKMMMRLGPGNEAAVKEWLREFRAVIAAPTETP